MSIPLVIVGAGAFGRDAHDVVEAMNAAAESPVFDFLGFIDNENHDPDLIAERGATVLGGDEVLDTLPQGTQYVIGINDGRIRRTVDATATAAGLEAAVLVHPLAFLGSHVIRLGPGTIVCALASITSNAKVGRHVHFNVSATIGHDCVIGDYVSVNPGAIVSGNVTLGDDVLIGSGASLIQGITIGEGTIIGLGAVVTRSIPAGVTAYGAPAKPVGPRS